MPASAATDAAPRRVGNVAVAALARTHAPYSLLNKQGQRGSAISKVVLSRFLFLFTVWAVGMALSCALPPSTAAGGQLSVPFLFGGENQRKCHRCHRSFSRPCNHRLPIIFASAGAQTEPIIVIIIYLYSLNLLLSSNRPTHWALGALGAGHDDRRTGRTASGTCGPSLPRRQAATPPAAPAPPAVRR